MKKRMNRILNVPVKKNKWRLLIGLYFMIGVSVFLVGCGESSDDKNSDGTTKEDVAESLTTEVEEIKGTKIKNTIDGNWKTYYELADGSWTDGDYSYKYRLVIKGRLYNAACDTVYVYLSNIPDISYEQAWKASGLSSNMNDYFSPKDAVLVEMKAVSRFDIF